MADLSHLSNDDLAQIAASAPDLSHLSNEQLASIANPPDMRGTLEKVTDFVTGKPTLEGTKKATIDALPSAGSAVGQVAGSALGPLGEIAGGGVGNVAGYIAKNATEPNDRPWYSVSAPGLAQAAKDEGSAFINGMNQAMSGKILSKGIEKATGLFSTAKKATSDAISSAAQRLGIEPTPGMTSDSPVVQTLENSLAQGNTLGGSLMRSKTGPVQSGLQNAAEDLVSGGGSSSQYQTGVNVSQGVIGNVGEKMNNIKMAYEPFNQELPKMIPDEVDKYKLADQINGALTKNHIGREDLSGLSRSITNNLMDSKNLSDVEELRKSVGLDLSKAYSENDGNLVKTLTKVKDHLSDFRDDQFVKLAQQAAPGPMGANMGPQMVDEYKNAMAQHAEVMNNLKDIGPIFGINAKNPRDFIESFDQIPPEQVAKKLFTPNNFENIQKVQQYFPEEFEQIKASKLQELRSKSLVKPIDPDNSPVDPVKLISQINKMSPEIRDVLFGDKAQTVKDMQTVLGSLPAKVGASGTPQGEAVKQTMNPIEQGMGLLNYGGYKAFSSTMVQTPISGLNQLSKTIPGQAAIGMGASQMTPSNIIKSRSQLGL